MLHPEQNREDGSIRNGPFSEEVLPRPLGQLRLEPVEYGEEAVCRGAHEDRGEPCGEQLLVHDLAEEAHLCARDWIGGEEACGREEVRKEVQNDERLGNPDRVLGGGLARAELGTPIDEVRDLKSALGCGTVEVCGRGTYPAFAVVDFLLVPVGLGHEIDPDSVVGRLGFFECQSDPVWERRILFVVSRCRDAS